MDDDAAKLAGARMRAAEGTADGLDEWRLKAAARVTKDIAGLDDVVFKTTPHAMVAPDSWEDWFARSFDERAQATN